MSLEVCDSVKDGTAFTQISTPITKPPEGSLGSGRDRFCVLCVMFHLIFLNSWLVLHLFWYVKGYDLEQGKN